MIKLASRYYKGGNGDLQTAINKTVVGGTAYTIIVGNGGTKNANGGASSAFNITANGGSGATDSAAGANAGNGKGGIGGTSTSGSSGWVKITYKMPVMGYFDPRLKS